MLIFQAFVYNYTIALFTCALTGKKRPFRPTNDTKQTAGPLLLIGCLGGNFSV